MRPIARMSLVTLAALSVVPALSLVVLWAVTVWWPHPRPTLVMGVTVVSGTYWQDGRIILLKCSNGSPPPSLKVPLIGYLGAKHLTWGQVWVLEELTIPLARPLMLASVPPAVIVLIFAARRYCAKRSFGSGNCQKCGYDLRASPERCPECGTIRTATPAA